MTPAPVSAIVPVFGAQETLERALRSIAAQTTPPAEILLVDDGNREPAFLHALAARTPTARVITLPQNRGPASARNAGWAEAKERYVAFLDADDAWHPRKLEVQVAWMEREPGVLVSGHRIRVLAAAGSAAFAGSEVGEVRASSFSAARVLAINPFATPTVLVRRDCGFRFREGMRHTEDHALWMEMAVSGCRIVRLEAELAAIFKPLLSAQGQSSQLWAMERGELDAYRYLKTIGKLGAAATLGLSALSLVKFVRRLLLVRVLQPLFKRPGS